jgi:hypothetical protein
MTTNELATNLATFSTPGRYWLVQTERGLDLDLNHCDDLDDVINGVLDCLTAGETVDRHGEPCDLETAWDGWRVVRG